MKAIEICQDLYWVGAVDWALRDFHGYATEQGSTYNAFLIRGKEHTVLVDTVKVEHASSLLESIREVLDPATIDIVVSNHAEMDHSGALPAILEACAPKQLVCSADGKKTLLAHFHRADWPFVEVGEDSTLDLGGRTLQFMPSKMLHWPDSMVSYLVEERLLFSNDIFGQHLASSARYDDEVAAGELNWQAAKYFANIFWPTAPAMKKFLTRLDDRGWQPRILAPDHGVLWRADVEGIRARYRGWSEGVAQPKAVIIFDTMWDSTAQMARAVARGLDGPGVELKVFDLRKNHRSDVVADLLEARAVVLGSPVFNTGLLPGMNDLLSYLKGLKPRGKIGASFGSYGWADTGVRQLNAALEEMKVELVSPGVSAQYRPTEDVLERCLALGQTVRQSVLASRQSGSGDKNNG
ncbi:MAG: MBL fold metallo-hydrolase [Pseudomonadota bacterium]